MQDPSIPSADGTCHLLRLPRELRDIIHELTLLGNPFPIGPYIGSDMHKRLLHWLVRGFKTSPNYCTFFLTCKTLHDEVLCAYFATRTFYCLYQSQLISWLDALPTGYRSALRSIRVHPEVFVPESKDPLSFRWLKLNHDGRAQAAAQELSLLEAFRVELEAQGIFLKRGVLKANVWVGKGSTGRFNPWNLEFGIFEWKA